MKRLTEEMRKTQDGWEIRHHLSNDVLRPFQDSYNNFLSSSTNVRAEEDKPDKFAQEKGYKLEIEGLDIYVLRKCLSIASHGMGDVAVLETTDEPKSHIVLWGEHMKGWLNRGLADALIPMDGEQDNTKERAKNAENDISKIISRWSEFSENIQDRLESDYHNLRDEFAKQLKPFEPLPFCQKYLLPIKNDMWHDPDFYNVEGIKTLFSSNDKVDVNNHPIPK